MYLKFVNESILSNRSHRRRHQQLESITTICTNKTKMIDVKEEMNH